MIIPIFPPNTTIIGEGASQLPSGPGFTHCAGCGEAIPEDREATPVPGYNRRGAKALSCGEWGRTMFKRRVTWLGAALLLPLLSSCTGDMLVVPLRICVIQGATFAPAGQPVNLAAVTDKAHQIVAAASQIWRDLAEIGLLPYPDVRVVTDPNPATTGQQKVGDIIQDIGIGRGPSQELTMC